MDVPNSGGYVSNEGCYWVTNYSDEPTDQCRTKKTFKLEPAYAATLSQEDARLVKKVLELIEEIDESGTVPSFFQNFRDVLLHAISRGKIRCNFLEADPSHPEARRGEYDPKENRLTISLADKNARTWSLQEKEFVAHELFHANQDAMLMCNSDSLREGEAYLFATRFILKKTGHNTPGPEAAKFLYDHAAATRDWMQAMPAARIQTLSANALTDSKAVWDANIGSYGKYQRYQLTLKRVEQTLYNLYQAGVTPETIPADFEIKAGTWDKPITIVIPKKNLSELMQQPR